MKRFTNTCEFKGFICATDVFCTLLGALLVISMCQNEGRGGLDEQLRLFREKYKETSDEHKQAKLDLENRRAKMLDFHEQMVSAKKVLDASDETELAEQERVLDECISMAKLQIDDMNDEFESIKNMPIIDERGLEKDLQDIDYALRVKQEESMKLATRLTDIQGKFDYKKATTNKRVKNLERELMKLKNELRRLDREESMLLSKARTPKKKHFTPTQTEILSGDPEEILVLTDNRVVSSSNYTSYDCGGWYEARRNGNGNCESVSIAIAPGGSLNVACNKVAQKGFGFIGLFVDKDSISTFHAVVNYLRERQIAWAVITIENGDCFQHGRGTTSVLGEKPRS